MTTAAPLTLSEFLKLPETKPASEYIHGRIFQKPMPQGKHSRLQFKFCDVVNQVAETPQIALAFPELLTLHFGYLLHLMPHLISRHHEELSSF